MKLFLLIFSFQILLISGIQGQTDFYLNGQLRLRSEWRNGYGTLKPANAPAAFFTSQRSRLTAGFASPKIETRISIQDIRLWGQDASTISPSDGSRLMVQEAWAQLNLLMDSSNLNSVVPKLQLKLGRQSLLYDDSRLLGDMDWLQQGRRHDAMLIRYKKGMFRSDAGFAFNQYSDAIGRTGTYYLPGNVPPYVTNSAGTLVATPPGFVPLAPSGLISEKSSLSGMPVLLTPAGTNGMNQMYKSMQFLHLSAERPRSRWSFLFLSDQFARYRPDSIVSASGVLYGRRYDLKGVHARFTYGSMVSGSFLDIPKRAVRFTFGLYGQSGHDKDGNRVSAWHFTSGLQFQYGSFSVTPGLDYLSGNDPASGSTVNHRFDPLYGTPHKFWGMMDYYYAGSGSPAAGLINPNVKSRYTLKKGFLSLDLHQFLLAHTAEAKNGGFSPGANLGWELDLVAQRPLNAYTTLELGYSFMAATNNTEYVKRNTTGQSSHSPQWAYISLNIQPDFHLNANRH